MKTNHGHGHVQITVCVSLRALKHSGSLAMAMLNHRLCVLRVVLCSWHCRNHRLRYILSLRLALVARKPFNVDIVHVGNFNQKRMGMPLKKRKQQQGKLRSDHILGDLELIFLRREGTSRHKWHRQPLWVVGSRSSWRMGKGKTENNCKKTI